MTQWNENDPRALDPFAASVGERNLRREMDRLARANKDVPMTDHTIAGGVPPKVTGLQLVSNIGSIHVKWVPSPITDLKTYELQIATNGDFTRDVVTKETREIEYDWEEGDSDTTYYVRLRAINISNNGSPWSSRLNTSTGKVATADIDVNATTQVTRFIYGDDGGETFTTLGGAAGSTGDSESYGELVVEVFDIESVISPTIIFDYEYAVDYLTAGSTCDITIELFRREQGSVPWGTAINDATIEIRSSIPNIGGSRPALDTAITTMPTFANFDTPGQGTWEYQITVTVNYADANVVQFTGSMLELEFWQSKR